MYPLVLTQPEISCIRMMLRILLASWVRDSVNEYEEHAPYFNQDRHDSLTKKFLSLNSKYRDLDYQFFVAQAPPQTTVVIDVSESHFNTLCRLVDSKIIHDRTLPEGRALSPVLIDRLPAVKAALEVAQANSKPTPDPNMPKVEGLQ